MNAARQHNYPMVCTCNATELFILVHCIAQIIFTYILTPTSHTRSISKRRNKNIAEIPFSDR